MVGHISSTFRFLQELNLERIQMSMCRVFCSAAHVYSGQYSVRRWPMLTVGMASLDYLLSIIFNDVCCAVSMRLALGSSITSGGSETRN